jgi:hypothetical protein
MHSCHVRCASAAVSGVQLPGRYVLPVCLWPCAKLGRGVALISSSVWSALVQPEQGVFLALYSLQPASHAGGL